MSELRRPLILCHQPSGARVALNMASSERLLNLAEYSRERFSQWLGQQSDSPLLGLGRKGGAGVVQATTQDELHAADVGADDRPAAEANLILLAHYLQFLSTRPNNEYLIQATLKHFHFAILKKDSIDVHSAAFDQTSSDQARRLVIKAYYLARHSIAHSFLDFPAPPVGKLWKSDEPKKKLAGVFGGQGNFSRLPMAICIRYPRRTMHRLAHYTNITAYTFFWFHYLSMGTSYSFILFRRVAVVESAVIGHHPRCAVSLPLIGLVQIAHYIALGRVQGLSPNQLSSQLSAGVTGHSQGIVVATLIGGRLASHEDTWTKFNLSALHAISLLFHIGLQGSLAFPLSSLPPKLISITAESEGIPTPMLAVTGLLLGQLQKSVDEVSEEFSGDYNSPLPDAQVSLFNGSKAFVVTGHPRTLAGLVSLLKKSKADPSRDQSKIPFRKRLPAFSMRFLPIGVPYHSHHLQGCTSRVMQPVTEGGIGIEEQAWWEAHKSSLGCPVFHTETGADLRTQSSGLLESLAEQIFTCPVQWSRACAFPQDTTHIIDFGLGTLAGIGSLVARNIEGKGHRIVFAGLPASGQGSKIMNEVYDSINIVREQRWSEKYKIRLVKTKDGRLQIDTPFSRLLSKPPLMVAGMTPCTVPAEFNAAVMNAGYHVELAGGGHYNAKGLRSKITTIQAKLQKPGLGFTLNALYINQKQWAFQFPLWLEMRKEGLPMEGFVVAAGIPSTEKAHEIIDGLRGAGIKHVSFKPGSVDGIRQVINIAAANPDFPVICQWTGGRAGGHHSCEDFHQPILATYASIRSQSNLILVAGSGFGSAEDVYPYLTGRWSRDRFGVEMMPFDGVLFASRMMVAREAATSQSVKELIVKAAGVSDEEWEGTYERETGGIITVTSELGEPIHKIATRGIKLWKEFDETVFAFPREKRLRRIEERLSVVNGAAQISELQSYSELEDPFPKLKKFFARYPEASNQILASEDIAYFLNLCQRPGQKPVPFIPVLDAQFGIWFKKDSLWQAEDIDAVIDQDPQRVAILQGPVAVRHSKSTEQSAGEILSEIESGLVSRLLEDHYDGDESLVPRTDFLCPHVDAEANQHTLQLSAGKIKARSGTTTSRDKRCTQNWLQMISMAGTNGQDVSWLTALLRSLSVVQGSECVDNPLKAVLSPRTHQRVQVFTDQLGRPLNVKFFGGLNPPDEKTAIPLTAH
ncbi:hypothetical protein PSHT_13446 [Puccinia striiformis]|uniref:Malonyl-CoA:ACP transacylase (MAT) domain-containing protein n=1 Tax=Puccinia striiformis TaxID=27350 RepID=A0A2S4UQI9_9BASI|nr:hypothetical protein PSHT_13446 [Puccinia striiformis]